MTLERNPIIYLTYGFIFVINVKRFIPQKHKNCFSRPKKFKEYGRKYNTCYDTPDR